MTSWREGGFKCNVPYPGPLGTQEEEGEGAQTLEVVLGVIKRQEPEGGQTWVPIPRPLFPSSVTWSYYFISLGLGFIICEIGVVLLTHKVSLKA